MNIKIPQLSQTSSYHYSQAKLREMLNISNISNFNSAKIIHGHEILGLFLDPETETLPLDLDLCLLSWLDVELL